MLLRTVFLFGFLFSVQASAVTTKQVVAADRAYNATLQMCLNPKVSQSIELAYQGGRDFFSDLLSFNVVWRGLKASHHLGDIWENEGYVRALNFCFGNDTVRKNLFTASLLATDIAGKAVGTAAATGVLFKFVPAVFAQINWVLLAPAKWIGSSAYYGFHTLLWSTVAFDVYHKGRMAYRKWKFGFDPEVIDSNPQLREVLDQYNAGKISKVEMGDKLMETTFNQFASSMGAIRQQVLLDLEAKEQLYISKVQDAKDEASRLKFQNVLNQIQKLKKDMLEEESSEQQATPTTSLAPL